MKAKSMKLFILLIHRNSLVMEQQNCLFIVAVVLNDGSKFPPLPAWSCVVTSWYIEPLPNNDTAVNSSRSLDCKPDCDRLATRQTNRLKNSIHKIHLHSFVSVVNYAKLHKFKAAP